MSKNKEELISRFMLCLDQYIGDLVSDKVEVANADPWDSCAGLGNMSSIKRSKEALEDVITELFT
jgi:hypothetical protein